jgi:NAD(P)H dehydrogenase (quinone)
MSILVVYYSRFGNTELLARQIAHGVDSVTGQQAVLRTVPPVSPGFDSLQNPVPSAGPPYVTLEELAECDGLIIGSPTRFGNMAAPIKYFLDSTSSLWAAGTLAGKPAAVFTSTQTIHGGHEATQFSLITPLLHHGMLIVGVPYTEPALTKTQGGGSPYGAGTLHRQPAKLSEEETQIAQVLGRRVAEVALKLATA